MACTEDINRSRNYMSISVKINYVCNYQKYKSEGGPYKYNVSFEMHNFCLVE